jgi:hypothetical protein
MKMSITGTKWFAVSKQEDFREVNHAPQTHLLLMLFRQFDAMAGTNHERRLLKMRGLGFRLFFLILRDLSGE